MRRYFLFFCLGMALFIGVVGCKSVQVALDNYEACQGNSICIAEMEAVRSASYTVTKSAVNSFPLPNVGETIAITVSNLLAFVFGMFRGKRKG